MRRADRRGGLSPAAHGGVAFPAVSDDVAMIPEEHLPPARRWASITSGVMLVLGILTMLRSGAGEWDVVNAREVILWPGHFLTGVAELAIGLSGIWCATREDLARGWLTISGLLLCAWAGAGLVLDGEPNDVFTGDLTLVAVHGVTGLVSIAVAAWTAAGGQRG